MSLIIQAEGQLFRYKDDVTMFYACFVIPNIRRSQSRITVFVQTFPAMKNKTQLCGIRQAYSVSGCEPGLKFGNKRCWGDEGEKNVRAAATCITSSWKSVFRWHNVSWLQLGQRSRCSDWLRIVQSSRPGLGKTSPSVFFILYLVSVALD
jgi:hypothetical protein